MARQEQQERIIIDERPVRRFTPQFSIYVVLPIILVTLFALWQLYRLIQWITDHIGAFWSANWGWLVTVAGVVLLGALAPHIFKGWRALRNHHHDMQEREARTSLIRASAKALELAADRGHNTELGNTITGDFVKTVNPLSLAPAARNVTNHYTGLPAPGETTADGEEEEDEIEQPTIEEIIRETPRNSYQLGVGRSLTTGELIFIDFYKKHLKIIGASQKGKSSEIAAILRILTSTHDPDRLLIAPLDLEDLTCHLFEDLPHIARYQIDEQKSIPLIARSREQVVEYLELLVNIMEYRYTLKRSEVKALPPIIVYIEELIALKTYFKEKIKAAKPLGQEAVNAAQAMYARLIGSLGELARRGLKARIQLLVSAQCDYRDDDLVDAWINIPDGLSFSVIPTAAFAAGFRQMELLNQNYQDGEVGQFVCEVAGYNDIGMAPWFPLEDLIAQWEDEQEAKEEQKGAQGVIQLGPYLAVNGGRAVGDLGRQKSMEFFNAPTDRLDLDDEPQNTVDSQAWAAENQTSANGLGKPAGDSPTTRQHYPKMSESQIEKFKTLYPVLGIEKALDAIPGCSHRHRVHARAIVQQFGLKRNRK